MQGNCVYVRKGRELNVYGMVAMEFRRPVNLNARNYLHARKGRVLTVSNCCYLIAQASILKSSKVFLCKERRGTNCLILDI